MQNRRFNVSARSKGRITVNIGALISAENGTLTKDELANMKSALADRVLFALADVPHLHVNISDMKVTR